MADRLVCIVVDLLVNLVDPTIEFYQVSWVRLSKIVRHYMYILISKFRVFKSFILFYFEIFLNIFRIYYRFRNKNCLIRTNNPRNNFFQPG
jgi:hypothetical protein